MDLKSPRCIAILLSQFKGNYVHLSTQKFGSHVVERCLGHFEESRLQIVLELVSVPHFEQLLQDPFANYVIQCALAVTKRYPGEKCTAGSLEVDGLHDSESTNGKLSSNGL
ncbi:unnamed protein product [Dovyalis caffra]|uniref:PUM-HD domain-containing protein n=1 Tax=Dovyalis caffra TaxID=77055 RepID=A0AAV1S848_9ROSI|nr:unnamed protein product [Dovyalis caffra]